MNDLTFMGAGRPYEDMTKAGFRVHDPAYEPAYGRANGLSSNPDLCTAIEAAVVACQYRFGTDGLLFFTAFADYLFENYHVPDVDCEFLAMMATRQMLDTAQTSWKHCADVILKKLEPYIDWEGYQRDHPGDDVAAVPE